MSSIALSITTICLSLLLLALFPLHIHADVRCRTGEFAHSCPSNMPVCCFDASGFSTGCCHTATTCSIDGNCDPGPAPPPNTTETDLSSVSSVVHFSWRSFYLTIGVSIFTLLLTSLAVFSSGQFRSYMARRRVELRARQLREAGHLGNGENGSDLSDADGNNNADLGYEPDAEVTSDDEREFRSHVLSSEEATIEHAIEAAKRGAGVLGRVSAWFKTGGNGSTASTKNMNNELTESPRRGAQQQQQKKSSSDSVSSVKSPNTAHLQETSSNYGSNAAIDTHHVAGEKDDEGDDDPSVLSERSHLLSASPHVGSTKPQQQQQQPAAPAAASASSLPEADATDKYLLACCILCKIRLSNCSLLPCFHSSVCEDCAAHMKRCPECKTVIKKRIKIYTS